MALTWPYGIPPDPHLYAYLAAAAASYPYSLPSAAAFPYPSMNMQSLPTSSTSAFTPLTSLPSGHLPPRLDVLQSLTNPLSRPSSLLDTHTVHSSSLASLSAGLNLSHRASFPWLDHAPSLCGATSGKPCSCGIFNLGFHSSLPTNSVSSLASHSLSSSLSAAHQTIRQKAEAERT